MSRQERERRYISEYMLNTYPEGNYKLNVPVGPIPDDLVQRYGAEAAALLFRPTRLRVDAVHWSKGSYEVVEAKLRNIKDGIGDLLVYQKLITNTPDLPYYDGQPFRLILVVPVMVDWIKDITQAHDIEYAVFSPEWVYQYAQERQNYFTAEYRESRRKTMELRKILDVE